MGDPPDPGGGGGSHSFQPPSPAAYAVITTTSTEKENASDRSHRRRKSRNYVARHDKSRSRSRSRSLSNKDDSSNSSNSSVVSVLQAGQCTPPSSFSFVESLASPPTPSSNPSVNPGTSDVTPVFTPIGRQIYGPSDRGPFTVHVQRTESSPTSGSTLHPVTFGRFIFSRFREFDGIVDGSIKSIGRNRITLNFHSSADANKFLQSPSLPNSNFKAFVPSFNITRLGVVRGIPVDMSPEDIIKEVNVPVDCGPIIKARRLNFKTIVEGSITWKPSQTVVLTFDGQVLPNRVFLYYNSFSVVHYDLPTIQCYNCCRYGHTKSICRSNPTCYKCSLNHTGESCSVDQDKAKCILCEGNHFANNKCCPEMDRQKKIKFTMSRECLSYPEASKLFERNKPSYANITSTPAPLSPSRSRNLTTEPQKIHYRKTISKTARIPPPVSVGYDHAAHLSIIRNDVSEAAPNGCALQNNVAAEFPSIQIVVAELLKLLNVLSSYMHSSSPSLSTNQPSNAAFNLNSLISLLQNVSGRQDPSMELS